MAKGDHLIKRGSGESGIFMVSVKYSGTSGIEPHNPTLSVRETEYYDLQGQRLDGPRRGLMIQVKRLSDGSILTKKVTC